VEKNRDLPALAARSAPLAAKLQEINAKKWPVRFSHVVDSAQPFLLAALAGKVERPIWVICPSVRTQESFYETLVNWLPTADFLPEAEFAAVENILPDPEITAERLAVLAKIGRRAVRVIVATRASLDQPAPKASALVAAAMFLQ